jgi:mono/diheme cytochrome c family protein
MKRSIFYIIVFVLAGFFLFLQINCSSKKEMSNDELIARGKYIANIGGCNDCHSPKLMTQMGPVPDTTKLLSGYHETLPILPIDTSLTSPGKWIITNDELTKWVGPWGITFAANITPDSATGIGAWTLDNFTATMRTGKHLGTGRMILPPMPWQSVGQLSDEDMKALFTYIQSVPAINNRVPNPVPPNFAGDKNFNK